MDKDYSLELIEKLSQATGLPGYEDDVRKIIKEELKDFEYSQDNIGNLVYTFKGKEDGKTILFCAHMDEIGFMVSDILET